ncbi:hypothetical protein BDZ89DRAFT_995593 [Hymenopellis radicata]|nr:hypothetical protein BDZ89DRAFT_995593 [Hymenopellis radicata]
MALPIDLALYDQYMLLAELRTATKVLVMLRGMVEDETPRPSTNTDFCSKLLSDNPMLLESLRHLWNQKTLHKAVGTSLLSDNPPKTHWTERLLFSDVVQLLRKTKARIAEALDHKQFPRHIWKPEMALAPRIAAHIEDLRIPLVEGTVNHRPVLLLYGLGTFQTDPILCERLDNIFHANSNTFLVNGSASGKTKVLYEGLCKHWGLFFTCEKDGTNLGTDELRRFSEVFPAGFRSASSFSITSDPRFAPPSQIEYIHATAHRMASEILFTRLLLLKVFLELLPTGTPSLLHRRLWLCFQLQPSLLHADVKNSITGLKIHIRNAGAENWFIDNAIRDTLEEIFRIWTPSDQESLFIAIDEANCCTDPTPLLRESEDDSTGIPVLKELLRIWNYHTKDFNVTFVVAGVRIVRQHFDGSEWSSYRWSSDTGDFMRNPKFQKEYLQTFLPVALGRSAAGLALGRRMERWLRGRHRLTASFITELLEQGFRTPHLYLNKYVSSFIGCLPQDEREFYESGEVEVGSPYHTSVLPANPNPVIISSMHDALLKCLVTGETDIVFGSERIRLVNEVVGRFVDADMEQITIDEPLMLIAAAQWFKKKAISISSLSYYRRPEFRPFRNISDATYFIVLGILRTFTRPRLLVDLLSFARVPAWAHQKVQLITLHRLSGKKLKWSYQSYKAGAFTQLAYVADSLQDTVRWFNNLGRDGFPSCCIHDSPTSPVVFFPVQLEDNTAMWITLRVSVDVSADADDLFLQMHPDHMLRPTETTSSRMRLTAKHFQQLPSRRTDIGEFALLRVLAPLYDEGRQIGCIDSSQTTPCAVLEMSKFDEITSLVSPDDTLKDIIANATRISQSSALNERDKMPIEM